MIRKMKLQELPQVAEMLRAMTIEVYPKYYSKILADYSWALHEHIINGDTIYVDDDLRGFFVVRVATDSVTPSLVMYEAVRLYVKPEFRHTKLLYNFYERMYEDFTDGDIIGITDINSKHIPILEKRQERIANVYKITRS